MKKLIFLLLFIPILVLAQPSNLQVNNITSTSVDLSWLDASCGNAFQLRYRLSSSTSWNSPITVFVGADTSLVGLTANTAYDWKVKCSGGAWSSVESFTTLPPPMPGCIDPTACNYDATATVDDGSCILPDGCTDATACNYNSSALCDDGSCILPDGCTDATACNYNSLALCDDGSCDYTSFGCMDGGTTDYTLVPGDGADGVIALNYDPTMLCDDGSCVYVGPTISNAFVSQPILCNGGFATDEMQIDITQTTSATAYKGVIGYYNSAGTYFSSYFSTNISTANVLNITGFNPNVDYFVRIVDSLSYYNNHLFGGGLDDTTGIFDEFGPITFTEPAELVATANTVATNICFGDCIAEEEIVISGGTQPYNYTLDANPLVTLGATETVDTINALCEGTYSLVVSDANGCSTSPKFFLTVGIMA